MKIAVSVGEKGKCMHFGYCKRLVLFDIDEATGIVNNNELVRPVAYKLSELLKCIYDNNVKVIIACGMTKKIQMQLSKKGINVIVGAPDSAPQVLVESYIAGKLCLSQGYLSIDPNEQTMQRLQQVLHQHCIICGKNHPQGLRMSFSLTEGGWVQSVFNCNEYYQGYNGYIQGGVISSLLDSAMVNCLFAYGIAAVTGELKVNYILPVTTNAPASVNAWIERSDLPLHYMQATLEQKEKVVAKASATFMNIKANDLNAITKEGALLICGSEELLKAGLTITATKKV